MRTKNAKRLWPVPATLGVVALAALLAFGLMATTGAQPAAAQSDPDCEITVSADGNTATLPTGGCDAVGDTATVQFTGDAAATEDAMLSLLIEDKAGTITAYPNNAGWSTNIDPDGIATSDGGTVAAEAKKYRFMSVTVPEAAQNPSTGIVEGQKVTIMVQGDLYVWEGTVSVTADVEGATNIPQGHALRGAQQIADGGELLDITFLGVPAIGKDADTDFNKEVDDVTTIQCRVTDDTDNEIVSEVATGTCPTGQEAISPNPDESGGNPVEESRSKLVAVTTAAANNIHSLLDGGELEIDMGEADGVTIYAVIEDKDQNELMDAEVTFSATETPSGIIAASDRTDEEDTEAFGTTTTVTGIASTDAVATFPLDDLADIEGAYRITIELKVGSLDLGTVILKREGDPEIIKAGVFNAACFTPGGDDDDDYSVAKFNDKNEGCTAMGDAQRFGAGEMIFVKAHLEDTLGTFVGDGTTLDSELVDEDSNLLGDADMLQIEDPVETGDPARAWVYTVDKDASLGDHMITVSTTAKDSENEDIDDVTLTITVAGPPANLDVTGNTVVPLRASGTFTVTATDELGGVPFLTEGENDKVTVSVQPTDALVTGVDSSNQVTLDDDGTAEFTIFASLTADYGDAGRIIVQQGDLQDILPITFGHNRAPMAGAAMTASVYTGMTTEVVSTISDPDGDTLTWSVMSSDTAVATATVDAGTVTIMGVAPGTAVITVTGMDAVSGMSGTQMINVTVADMPLPMLGDPVVTGAMSNAAGSAMISLTPGANADQHWIWAQPTDLSQGMFSTRVPGDATSFTMTGLTSGMSYWFTAVAGRDMEDGTTEWSNYSGWSAATAIQ